MQKLFTKSRLATFALLAALPLTALAQSSVVIGGRIDLAVQNLDNGVDSTQKMFSGLYTASRLTFRGTEDLGGGLFALFFLEHGFQADTGAGAPKFWNRGSYVGLEDRTWGRLTLGRQYVPIFWPLLFGDESGALRLHSYSATQSIERTNLARVTAAASPIKTQGTLDAIAGGIFSIGTTSAFEDNLVVYKSPTFAGGLSLSAAVGAPEGYPVGGGKIYGANLEYRVDSLYLGAGYNSKEGRVPVGGTGEQKVEEGAITGQYSLTKEISIWGNYHPYKFTSAGTELKGSDYMLGTTYRTGQHLIWANYGARSLRSGCVECNSSGFGIGYHYMVSKRTELYASFGMVMNDANSAAGLAAQFPGAPGLDVRGFGAGIAHIF